MVFWCKLLHYSLSRHYITVPFFSFFGAPAQLLQFSDNSHTISEGNSICSQDDLIMKVCDLLQGIFFLFLKVGRKQFGVVFRLTLEAAVHRLHIIEQFAPKKHRDRVRQSGSNTMIVCLPQPVVRPLHQAATLMTACHGMLDHLHSQHQDKTPVPSFFRFFSRLQTLLCSLCYSLFPQEEKDNKQRQSKGKKEKITGIEQGMEKSQGSNLDLFLMCVLVCVDAVYHTKGQVN